jgi:hypothetical protein
MVDSSRFHFCVRCIIVSQGLTHSILFLRNSISGDKSAIIYVKELRRWPSAEPILQTSARLFDKISGRPAASTAMRD